MSKLIFSINSGRSGSKYLADLFNAAENTISFHEAPPQMANHEIMKMVCQKPYSQSYDLRKDKIKAIKTLMHGYENYAESNHMFIKTFFDIVIDEFRSDLFVIVLRRHLPLIVKSFVELEYFGKNEESFKWMIRSDAITRAIDPIGPFDKLDLFDRTISYLIDIEARTERFKKDFPDIKVIEYNIEDLNNIKNVLNMFDIIGLKPKDNILNIVNVPVNQRQHRKHSFKRNVSFQEACDRVDLYIRKAKMLGITIPSKLYI